MFSKLVFTTGDVANLLHVHQTTVIDWVDKGHLKSYRTPGGHRRISKEELLKFMAAHQMPIPTGMTVDQTKAVVEKHRPIHESFQQGPVAKR